MNLFRISKFARATFAFLAIAIGTIIGFVAILFYATQASNAMEFFSVVGVSMLIAGVSIVAGGLLGFLFGIPRTLQAGQSNDTYYRGSQAENSLGERTQGEGKSNLTNRDQESSTAYIANTNLEQISDWLTKIIVGVGLTQLNKVPETLIKLGDQLSPALGNFESSATYSVTLILFYSVCGFLMFYLWTRLYMAGELKRADISAQVGEVETRMQKFEDQSKKDAEALRATQRQLNPPEGIPGITEPELTQKIKDASSEIKAQIFYQAQSIRKDNWRNPETKYKMERTIPIFRALISSDKDDDIYHANHGQLGFALKDKREPENQEAEKELSEAIEIRGDGKKEGWLSYEFNRAVSRIRLDQNYKLDKPSTSEVRQVIIRDLSVGYQSSEVKGWFPNSEAEKWMELNGVTFEDLANTDNVQ